MSDDLLSRLNRATSDEEKEWLVLQFNLEGLEAPLREAVQVAAIPHWFDVEFLAALLNQAVAITQPLFEKLTALSFIEPFPGHGYDVHERTRRLLLGRLWRDNPARYRQLSQRASTFCSKRKLDDSAWRIEFIYHLLTADPDAGADQMQATCAEWHGPPAFSYAKVDALASAAREHADAGRLNDRAIGWTLFWEGVLDFDYSRFPSAKNKLTQISIGVTRDAHLATERLFWLGTIHCVLNENEAARGRFKEALKIYRDIGNRQGEAACLWSLGDIHRTPNEHEGARDGLEEALKIYQDIRDLGGEANCLWILGEIHRTLDENDAARQRLEEALKVFRDIGNRLGEATCLQSIGEIHRALDENEAARQRLEEALKIFRDIGDRAGEANCLKSLGDVDRALNENQAARQRLEEALKIYREIGSRLGEANCLQRLGDTDRILKENEAARQHLEEGLKIYRDIGNRLGQAGCLQSLNEVGRALNENETARGLLEEALKIYRDIGSRLGEANTIQRLGDIFTEH